MNYWLLKSEPQVYSVQTLAQSPSQTTCWEGVRNYQARNFLKNCQLDDLAFFYHSNCSTPGIVGIVKVIKTAYPDPSALTSHSPYYDVKSKLDAPRWVCIDIQLVKQLSLISIVTLKRQASLTDLIILKPGNRLSVSPVSETDWHEILRLGG